MVRTNVLIACGSLVLALLSSAVPSSNAELTIPYDNTLVLGNIIKSEKITALEGQAQLGAKVNQAADSYNARVQNKLSLDMSIQELNSMGLDTTDLVDKQKKMDDDVKTSLSALVDARIEYQNKRVEIVDQSTQTVIGDEPESPLDFDNSKLVDLPLSSDTMNMNVQFFRTEQNEQGSRAAVAKISSFVSTSVQSMFGADVAVKAGAEAEKHTSRQHEDNTVLGTLVIAITATHKNAKIFSPTIYSADKLVSAWNQVNSDESLEFGGENTEKIYADWVTLKKTPQGADAKSLSILTGTTYGSSFVGFIYFLKKASTQSHEEMQSSAANAQAAATASNFFATITGSFGMDSSSAEDIKQLLSTTEITSHVSVITQGIIPSIASQSVAVAVKEFTKFSPDQTDATLSTLASNSIEAPDMDGGARAGIKSGQMKGIQQAQIQGVLSGVQKVDAENNKVLNLNSMMLAMDDYVKIAREAKGGIPVNFFVTKMTKRDVITAYFKANRPDLYQRFMNPKLESNPDPNKK